MPALVVAGAGLVWVYFGGAFPKFDSAFAVLWGGDVLDGQAPEYRAPIAPTPHPFATLIGIVSALGGGGAYNVLSGIVFLSLACLVLGVYQLARATALSWRAGLLAALTVATSYTMLASTMSSGLDVLVAAIIVSAAVLEVRRPRCGAPVLLLLAAAGLQRPEAWVLSGAYWLYLAPSLGWRRRLQFAALAVAGPAVWLASDLAVTGDPFFSFRDASKAANPGNALADGSDGGKTGMLSVGADGLRRILRLPVLLGSVVGLAISVLALRWRVRVPAALLALLVLAFLALGVAGLPQQARFLLPAAAILAVFFAVAAVAWLDHRSVTLGTVRVGRWSLAVWPVVGALLLTAFVSTVPSQVNGIADLRQIAHAQRRLLDDLRALTEERATASLLQSCERIYVTSNDVVPVLAREINRPSGDIAVLPAGGQASPGSTILTPSRRLQGARTFLTEPDDVRTAPRGYTAVAGNSSWEVSTTGCN